MRLYELLRLIEPRKGKNPNRALLAITHVCLCLS